MYEGWNDVTATEVLDNKKEVCAKCYYFSAYTISGNTNFNDSTCDYIGMEKRARGCLPTECVEKGIFKPKKKKRRRKKQIRIAWAD